MLWTALARRWRNPNAALKMGVGTLLLGLGFLAVVAAARESALGQKASVHWVLLAYLLHTAAELCLAPVGLSLVS